MKPQIPATGSYGLRIRDELELEKPLWVFRKFFGQDVTFGTQTQRRSHPMTALGALGTNNLATYAHRANQGQVPAPPPLPTPAEPVDGFQKTASGVRFKWSKEGLEGQHMWTLSATLPAAPLIGAPIVLSVVRDAQGQGVSATAQVEGQDTSFQTHVQKDGSVYVDMGADEPWLYYNSNNNTYGLSSRPVQDATGAVHRERQQYVQADGSQTMIFDEVSNPVKGEKTYTQVTSRGGELEALKIVDQGGKPYEPKEAAGWKKGWYVENPPKNVGWKETPFSAAMRPDGRLVLTDDAPMEARERSAIRSGERPDYAQMKAGWSSMMSWGKGLMGKSEAEPEVLTPFSAERQQAAAPQEVPPFLPPTGF